VGTRKPNCLKIIEELFAKLLIFKNQCLKFSGLLSQVGIVSSLSFVSNCGSGGDLFADGLTSSKGILDRSFHELLGNNGFLGPL